MCEMRTNRSLYCRDVNTKQAFSLHGFHQIDRFSVPSWNIIGVWTVVTPSIHVLRPFLVSSFSLNSRFTERWPNSAQMVHKTFCFRAINLQLLESVMTNGEKCVINLCMWFNERSIGLIVGTLTSGMCASNSPSRPGWFGAVCCK